MYRAIAAAALAALTTLGAHAAQAQERAALAPEVAAKFYELGYPADAQLAVSRWRADNRLAGTGELSDGERAMLLAQPKPAFVAAMVGNPFTGMGIAVRHDNRADAERDAIKSCRAQGGGSSCNTPVVLRAEQCAVLIGYTVKIDRRPHHRVSTAISTDVRLATERGQEACQMGASHPQMCRVLVKFCGDGSQFEIDGQDKTASAATAR